MEGAEAFEEAGVHLGHACDPYVVRLGELVRVVEPGVPGEKREGGGQGCWSGEEQEGRRQRGRRVNGTVEEKLERRNEETE